MDFKNLFNYNNKTCLDQILKNHLKLMLMTKRVKKVKKAKKVLINNHNLKVEEVLKILHYQTMKKILNLKKNKF